MQDSIKIAAFNIASMAYFLNTVLDHEHALYKKIRNIHQGIQEPGFVTKNDYFEVQYVMVEKAIHEIEEQIFQLGYYPEISLKGYLLLNLSMEIIKERTEHDFSVKSLLEDINSIIRCLQKNIELFPARWLDMDKSFLAALIGTHKKIAMMLSAQLWKAGEFFTLRIAGNRREIANLECELI